MSSVRWLAMTFCGFILLPVLFSQQPPTKPKKVLTPEQKIYQQQLNQWFVKHHSLQGKAKQVFDAEMAREKAGDCPDAYSTYAINVCLGKQTSITENNLKRYEELIRELMAPEPQIPGQPATNLPGPTGPVLTSEQLELEFDHVEQSWRQYRDRACTAAFHQFDGGTAGPPFEGECEQKLTRDHMRELAMIYEGPLSP